MNPSDIGDILRIGNCGLLQGAELRCVNDNYVVDVKQNRIGEVFLKSFANLVNFISSPLSPRKHVVYPKF